MAKKKIPSIVKEIREYSPESIDYSHQTNISWSQISTYTQCPKKWSLMYAEGHKIRDYNMNLVFGTAIHETIQEYLNIMYSQSISKADELDLNKLFETHLRDAYQESYKKNKKKHFSNSVEMREFFEDGEAILTEFKKRKSQYFSKKGWYLIGCEVPIQIPLSTNQNVIFEGHLDVLLYHEPTETFKIIDIKTSYKGWNDKAKKDELKRNQLLLYKKRLSEKFNIDPKKIEVEFFILKRKIWENSDFAIRRIQIFNPPSGKNKLGKVEDMFNNFVKGAFNGNGERKKNDNPTPNSLCQYCPFHKTHLCSATF